MGGGTPGAPLGLLSAAAPFPFPMGWLPSPLLFVCAWSLAPGSCCCSCLACLPPLPPLVGAGLCEGRLLRGRGRRRGSRRAGGVRAV